MEPRMGKLVPTVQLLSIGDAKVELTFSSEPKMPEFGRQIVASELTVWAAGSAANFALCGAALGVKTGFAVSMLSGATMEHTAVSANAVAALHVSRRLLESLFPSLEVTSAFLMRHRPLEA
ncbi:MAG: hypothetical protein ACFE9D_01540 [Promethearchaeota archaeon]